MTKRKQDLSDLTLPDLDDDWQKLREIGKAKQRDRIHPQPNPVNKTVKTPYVDCIMTRRVRYDEVKTKYIPIEEKQNIEITGNLSYDVAYTKIWDYYEQKHEHLSPATHVMHIITGVFGPKVYSTLQLGGKKDLLVQFTEKQETTDKLEKVKGDSFETKYGRLKPFSVSHAQISPQANPPVAKSIFPTLKLKACDVMQLGRKVAAEMTWTNASVRSLTHDPTTNSWIWSEPMTVGFHKGSLIGSGAFRNAYKCCLQNNPSFKDIVYVYKEFNEDAVFARSENMKSLGNEQSSNAIVKELNQKVVQSQACAQILAELFSKKFISEIQTPRYIASWTIEFVDGQFGSIEEFLEGEFTKHLNNSMTENNITGKSTLTKMALALVHFSYFYSEGEYLLTDIQGIGYKFTDPEIATKESYVKENGNTEMLFGAGSLCEALDNFQKTHQCNTYCKMANLSPLVYTVSNSK